MKNGPDRFPVFRFLFPVFIFFFSGLFKTFGFSPPALSPVEACPEPVEGGA
jgi:hypothetical protein